MTDMDIKLINDFTQKEERLNGEVFDMAIEMEKCDYEKIKTELIVKLRKMYIKRLKQYNRSKGQSESYRKRRILLQEFKWIEKMVDRLKKAQKRKLADVLEIGDLEEIKQKGREQFIKLNYNRIYEL